MKSVGNGKCEKLGKHKSAYSITTSLPDSPSSKLSKLVYKSRNCYNTYENFSKSQKVTDNVKVEVKKENVFVSNNACSQVDMIKTLTPEKVIKGVEINIGEAKAGLKLDSFISNSTSSEDVIFTSEILKNSYSSRGKLKRVHNTGISSNNDVLEWSMSANDSFCHVLNPSVKNGEKNKITHAGITSKRIVDPSVYCPSNLKISWENPVIGIGKKSGIPSLLSKNSELKRCDKVYSSCSFTKEMLKMVKVIGPVDDKFIACLLFLQNSDAMLVIVDQHAAHERIRLERLLAHVGYYYKTDKDKINGASSSTTLSPPATLSLIESELSLLLHYKKEFNNVGLNFSFIKSRNSFFHRVFILSAPAIFVDSNELKLEAKGSVLNTELLKEFIHEQIGYMKSTGCPCNMSSRAIFKVLSSYACHGAIKFGDKISLLTCKTIMKDLAKCDLPFQCAHGRPTIIPIFQLNFLDGILKKSLTKPKLLNILK